MDQLLQPGCQPSCTEHETHVYILCYGVPVQVSDRDYLTADPTHGYPISHYVGFTTQQPPVKRVRSHGARSAHFIARILPGSLADEDAVKRGGACPTCGGSLWYYAESPTYRASMDPSPNLGGVRTLSLMTCGPSNGKGAWGYLDPDTGLYTPSSTDPNFKRLLWSLNPHLEGE